MPNQVGMGIPTARMGKLRHREVLSCLSLCPGKRLILASKPLTHPLSFLLLAHPLWKAEHRVLVARAEV